MVTTQRGRGEGGGQAPHRLVCAFDDERAVANAGLLLVSTLAERLGIEQIVDESSTWVSGRARLGRVASF